MTQEAIQKQIQIMRDVAKEITKSKEAALKFLTEGGFEGGEYPKKSKPKKV